MSATPHALANPALSGVEHRHLAALAALARTGSFRGGARELGYSQSALSQHIAQLEALLGTRLAARQRGSGDVRLTDAGTTLLRHGRQILSIYRAAQADLQALAAPGPGVLRLGLAEHIAADVSRTVLPMLVQRHPGVTVELTCRPDAGALCQLLDAGGLDVVVGDPPDTAQTLDVTLLVPEPHVLIAPSSWRVVAHPDSRVGALLGDLPVVVNDADPDTSRMTRELRGAGVALRETTSARGLAAVLHTVRGGSAAAILPASCVPEDDASLTVRSLVDLVRPRPVAVMRIAARRYAPLADAFAAAVACARGCTETEAAMDRAGAPVSAAQAA